MTTLKNEIHPRAVNVRFTDAEMAVELSDGRTVSVPLFWFASLANATPEQLTDYELLGDGEGLHWPQLDEDLSVAGLLLGGNDT